jgi:spore coat polysaccharide biosynthesis protein SpsF (cytidylyltransferase family)
MTEVVIVQARLGSTRLPSKVIKKNIDKLMIELLNA